MTKPSNVVILGAAIVALAAWRRSRAAAVAFVASALVFAPQLALNQALNGNPLVSSYSDAWPLGDTRPLASLTYVPRTFGKLIASNYTGPVLVLAAVVALVVAWRRFPALRWLVVAQVIAFALFFSPLYYSISGYLVRFMTPALPALCLAVAATVLSRRGASTEPVVEVRAPGRLRLRPVAPPSSRHSRCAGFVVSAPIRPVYPVLEALAPKLEVRDGTVLLEWREPPAPARLGYKVERTSPHGDVEPVVRGAGTNLRSGRPTGPRRLRVQDPRRARNAPERLAAARDARDIPLAHHKGPPVGS